MATATITPASQSQLVDPSDMPGTGVPTGDSDAGVCLQTANDGKTLVFAGNVDVTMLFIDDTVTIPAGATINSVTIQVRLSGNVQGFSSLDGHFYSGQITDNLTAAPNFLISAFDSGGLVSVPSLTTFSTAAMTTNPVLGGAWLRSQLFSNTQNLTTGNSIWILELVSSGCVIDYFGLLVDYTAGVQNWYYNAQSNNYKRSVTDPGFPWTLSAAPTVVPTSVTPVKGSTLGGD